MTNICSMIIKTPTYYIWILETDNVYGQFSTCLVLLDSKKICRQKPFLGINSEFQEKISDFIEKHKNALQFSHKNFNFWNKMPKIDSLRSANATYSELFKNSEIFGYKIEYFSTKIRFKWSYSRKKVQLWRYGFKLPERKKESYYSLLYFFRIFTSIIW